MIWVRGFLLQEQNNNDPTHRSMFMCDMCVCSSHVPEFSLLVAARSQGRPTTTKVVARRVKIVFFRRHRRPCMQARHDVQQEVRLKPSIFSAECRQKLWCYRDAINSISRSLQAAQPHGMDLSRFPSPKTRFLILLLAYLLSISISSRFISLQSMTRSQV